MRILIKLSLVQLISLGLLILCIVKNYPFYDDENIWTVGFVWHENAICMWWSKMVLWTPTTFDLQILNSIHGYLLGNDVIFKIDVHRDPAGSQFKIVICVGFQVYVVAMAKCFYTKIEQMFWLKSKKFDNIISL